MEYDLDPKQLVEALTAAGKTQQQIADMTGIPQPTVSKIATGQSRDVLSRSYRALKAAYESVKAAEAGQGA